jgi:hypothetical protein
LQKLFPCSNEPALKNKYVIFALLILIALVAAYFVFGRSRLSEATPEEMGLMWQECGLTSDFGMWEQAAECFGHPVPIRDDSDTLNYIFIGQQGRYLFNATRAGKHILVEITTTSNNLNLTTETRRNGERGI